MDATAGAGSGRESPRRTRLRRSRDRGDVARSARAPVGRREFLRRSATGLGAAVLAGSPLGRATQAAAASIPPGPAAYYGPNVILVRFGGGVRRRETLDAAHTQSPFLCHKLAPRGTLFTRMEINADADETSHGQGTLNILTGKYDRYTDVDGRLIGERFEPRVPTVFEHLRKWFAVPPHQTLIVNGEDRIDEEFYTFSNHHRYGVAYRSTVLSLYRYKTYLLRRQLTEEEWPETKRTQMIEQLRKMESLDYRAKDAGAPPPELEAFWRRWRGYYGDSGMVNPRGDRLLTELTIRALRELRPKLLMVNYQDCDYVHWGNPSHYARGIQIMDQGLQHIFEAVQANAEYRENTVFVVVPDCGRDNNRLMTVPFQHHFGSRSAHEIFALVVGPGVARSRTVDRLVQQVAVAPTVGRLMGFETPYAEAPALEDAFA